MKTIFLTNIFTLFLINLGFAQNLVSNGDFELGPNESSEGWQLQVDNTCSSILPALGPDFWFIVNNTPDRMFEGDIPCNWDDDMAQSGQSYTIFGYQESAKTILLTPLKKDSVYSLKYYISLESFRGLGLEPNHVELRFNNGGNVISSPSVTIPFEWEYVDTVFTAAENSTELEIWGIEPAIGYSAVKIDNITLEKNSNATIYTILKNNVKLFHNTISSLLFVHSDYDVNSIEIINTMGKTIQKNPTDQINELKIDVSQLSSGFYFLRIEINNMFINKSFIIN